MDSADSVLQADAAYGSQENLDDPCLRTIAMQQAILNDIRLTTLEDKMGSLERTMTERLNSVERRPKFPGYRRYSVRHRSFNTEWPTKKNHGPSPEELAAAGFFYAGRLDHAQCFFCGVKLGRWRPTDRAYGEHVKFSPKCEFLHMIRPQ